MLQAIAQQYEMAKVDSEGGVKLKIDGVEGQDGVILERTEGKLRTRTVSLTAQASDEDGTRIRLLDEPPGSGPQEQYAFPDLGEPTSAKVIQRIHERVEEVEGRKLLSAEALRSYKLPPFDGVTRVEAPDITDPAHDTHGWLVGEEEWEFPETPTAVGFWFGESDTPLEVVWDCPTPHQALVTVVDGMADWRSHERAIRRLHQIDLEPASRLRLGWRLRPRG